MALFTRSPGRRAEAAARTAIHLGAASNVALAVRLAVAAAAAAAALGVRAQSPQPTLFPPLMVFYSAAHGDNAVVATAASAAALDSTYAFYATDLFVLSNTTQQPYAGTVPLNHYANAATHHHMTTASAAGNAWALANGYTLQRVEGWVVPVGSQDPSMLPVEMWYSAQRGDHFLVGTADNRANAVGAGYVLQYVDFFVPLDWTVWPSAPPAGIPFPASTDILDYELAWGANANYGNADTWYPSWAADGNMYSSWTDGSVDGKSSGSGGHGATTGFATILGDDPFNLTLANVSTFPEPADPYQGRYPSLCFHHGGVWYYGGCTLTTTDGSTAL